MEPADIRRGGALLGVAAVVLTLGAIGLAIVLSPDFAFSENALSNLGVASDAAGTDTTALVFNGGLILGGIAGIGFAVGIAATATELLQRLGAALLGLSMAAMAGVGVFPQGGPYHFEVASSFYLLFSVAALVYGVGQFRAGEQRAGLFSAILGAANVTIWIVWGVTVGILSPGLAIPETLGALLVAAFALSVVGRLRTGESL